MMAKFIAFVASLGLVASQPGMGRQTEFPKWASESFKDSWNELDSIVAKEHKAVTPELCQLRSVLFQELKGITEKDAAEFRYQLLNELSMCSLESGNFGEAVKRLDFALSEINAPNDQALGQMQMAHLPLAKKAARFLQDGNLESGMVELRRLKVLVNRSMKKILDFSLKFQLKRMMNASPEQKEQILKTTGGNLPTGDNFSEEERAAMLMRSRAGVATAGWIDIANKLLYKGDDALIGGSRDKKDKRFRLDPIKEAVDLERIAKGQAPPKQEQPFSSKKFYVPGLDVDAFYAAPSARGKFAAVESVMEFADVLVEDGKSVTKSSTLLDAHKKGSGCSSFPSSCDKLGSLPDFSTNVFGQSKFVLLKSKKADSLTSSTLGICRANVDVTLVLPLRVSDGASASVKIGEGSNVASEALEVLKPVVVDHCRNVEFHASFGGEGEVLLFVGQFWHPEVALIERLTYARLAEEEKEAQQEVTKAINAGKQRWEEGSAKYRKTSAAVQLIFGGQRGEAKNVGAEKEEKKREKKEKEVKMPASAPPVQQESDPKVAALVSERDALRDAKRNAATGGEMEEANRLNKEINKLERKIEKARKRAAKREKAQRAAEKGGKGEGEEGKAKGEEL